LLVAVALVLVAVAAFGYYRQSLRLPSFDRVERNLVTPEEQSLNLIRMGERAHELGDHETAIADFRQALSLTPRHTPTYLLLAQSLQSAGQLDEALHTYSTLLRQDPQNLEARLEVAEIHRARGNWREAYQEYQRIIATDSQSLEAVAALALIEAHDKPVPQMRPVDPTKRGVATARSSASLLPLILGRQTPLAVSPSQLQAGSLGAPPEAWTRTRTPDDERGDARALAETHKGLGMRYHNVREFQAAIREFSLAQRLTPSDKDLYYLIGSSYAGLGQNAVAHEYYKPCDSGPYASVARSGAQKTAKAARLEGKSPDGIGDADIGLPNRPTVNLK
jgi:tetratricopeptide (TPR) repeat protein